MDLIARLYLENFSLSKGNIFQLIKGTVYSYFKSNKQKQNINNTIKTKLASFGVRGTKFFIQSKTKDYLCVCKGEVEVVNNFGAKQTLKANEDIYITKSINKLKKLKASQMMIDLGEKIFRDMGHPVN